MESLQEAEIANILKSTDLDTITPIEAMNILYDLKKRASE